MDKEQKIIKRLQFPIKCFKIDSGDLSKFIVDGKTTIKVITESDYKQRIKDFEYELFRLVIWKNRFGALFHAEVKSLINRFLKEKK